VFGVAFGVGVLLPLSLLLPLPSLPLPLNCPDAFLSLNVGFPTLLALGAVAADFTNLLEWASRVPGILTKMPCEFLGQCDTGRASAEEAATGRASLETGNIANMLCDGFVKMLASYAACLGTCTVGRDPNPRSSTSMLSMAGFDMTSALSSIVNPSAVTLFLLGLCGNDTVAVVRPAGTSSKAALLEAAMARAGPGAFGGVFGGEGGTSTSV
jgi:hypothetical protein